MNGNLQETHIPKREDAVAASSLFALTRAQATTRRELLERYSKYALVAAPLLLFASKAHAIHSKP